jgi:hypothetical protein
LHSGFTKVPIAAGSVAALKCGSATIGFDAATGAIVQLSAGGAGSKEWANSSNPIGQYLYQSFDDDDYQTFLGNEPHGVPSGFGLGGCNPNDAGSLCGNFNKPRMALGGAKHRELPTTLASLWQQQQQVRKQKTLDFHWFP